MMLIEETTVPNAVLPVEEFKAHLRLGTGFGQETTQDEVLAGFLRASVAAIEARTGKILIMRRFSWTLSYWRDGQVQGLPVAPVTAVTGLVITSQNGAEHIVADTSYWLERDSQRPRLRASGGALPAIPQAGNARIEFDAGYGAAWEDVPADLQQAVFLLAAYYYEYRHEMQIGGGEMPFGVTSLIERYRAMRIGVGSM